MEPIPGHEPGLHLSGTLWVVTSLHSWQLWPCQTPLTSPLAQSGRLLTPRLCSSFFCPLPFP